MKITPQFVKRCPTRYRGHYASLINIIGDSERFIAEVKSKIHSKYTTPERAGIHEYILELCDDYPDELDDAISFYQNTPRDQRTKKTGHLPPTQKQTAFLASKGYDGVISTRSIAAQVIGCIIREGL